MSARRIRDLERSQRRREVVRTTVTILFTWTVALGAYLLLPEPSRSSGILVELGIGLVLFMTVAVWQIRRIVRSELPQMRAIEALGMLSAIFLVLFASTYLALDLAESGAFSVHLDRATSLYFTITVLSTVGFGDITPATATTRLVVSAQMVLDVVLLASLVKVLLGVARASLQVGPSTEAPAGGRPGPDS